jgi:O-antigen/teichoic acid export membrane protein
VTRDVGDGAGPPDPNAPGAMPGDAPPAAGREQARYARGVKFSAYETATSFVLGLASSVITARVFGAAVIGAFALASAITGAFQGISNVREQGGLVRELTRHEAGSPESRALMWATLAFSTLLTSSLFVPFLVVGVVLLRGTFDRPELVAPFLVLAAAYLVVDNTSFNINAPLVAYRDGRAVWFTRTAVVATTIVAAVLCGLLGARGIWGLVACTVAASAVGLAVRLASVRRLVGLRSGRRELAWARRRLRAIISFGIRSMPLNYAETASRYADTALLGANVPLSSLGAYNRSYGLYERVRTIPLSLSRLYFPTQSSLFMAGDRAGMARLYRVTVRYLALMLLPAATWVAVSAPAIMAIFGPDFVVGATALAILVFAVVLDAYGRTAGGLLSAADRPGRVSMGAMVGSAVNVGLCILLIPVIGLTGAALANLGGWVFTTLLFTGMAARVIRKPLYFMFEPRYLVRLGLGCAVFTALLLPLRGVEPALPLLALAAPPALAVALAIARPLDRADEDLVRRALTAAGFRSERLLRTARRVYRLISHDTARLRAPRDRSPA